MGLRFPVARDAVFDLLGRPGSPAYPFFTLQADESGAPKGPYPVAHIRQLPGGDEGFIDRADVVQVDVYAPGEAALDTAEDIRELVCGDQIDTSAGFIDSIVTSSNPVEPAHPSDRLNLAQVVLRVVSRPIV